MNETIKICSRCNITKSLDLFAKRSKSKYANECKECRAKYQHIWYLENRENVIKRSIDSKKDKTKEKQYKVYEYLLTHPCVDCGETDPVVLEFDHISNNKLDDIAGLISRGHGWESILNEIQKCEVRCCNCHRRKTAERGNWTILSFVSLT